MRRLFVILTSLATCVGAVSSASTQTSTIDQIDRLHWQRMSGSGQIASVAKIDLTSNLQFLDAQGTRRYLELNGNPPRDGQYTLARRD
jgi:hypothetical protein